MCKLADGFVYVLSQNCHFHVQPEKSKIGSTTWGYADTKL